MLSAYAQSDSEGEPLAGSTLTTEFQTFTVSSIAGTTISAGDSVTFRFYVQTPGVSAYMYFEDLIVTGTVAAAQTPGIPEPSTLALIAGSVVLFTSLHLRRHTRRL